MIERPRGMPDHWPTPDLDLGDGNYFTFSGTPDVQDGGHWLHRAPSTPSGWCEGWCPFATTEPGGWTVGSRDPLTLSPSLLCRICGAHGFIKEGRWVRV